VLWAVLLLLIPTRSSAHMMPAQQGTLNVLGDSVFQVVAVPCSALPRVDDDGDGRLSESEVARHLPELQMQVAARFRLYDRNRPLAQQQVVMIRAEHDERGDDSSAGAKNILVLLRAQLPSPPHALCLETDLFGSAEGEGQLTIRATRSGEPAEVAVLRPLAPSHCFFRSPSRLFADFLRLGIEHIVLGADHLQFLLTVLLAAASWRDWLAVLTSFTVAHCLSLTLAVLGVARVSPKIVEPLIAASIALFALLNLRRSTASTQRRVVVVFACGLLHGLGFASAITAMGIGASQRLLTLVGFNLGIEIGQALFLVVLLLVSYPLLRLPIPKILLRWAAAPHSQTTAFSDEKLRRLVLVRCASVLAAVCGTFWFFHRLWDSGM
jgi:hydrogenase/urease accessory protein HupE